MRKQQALLEYLRDVDAQSIKNGQHNYKAGQIKAIDLMRSDVEHTQNEIQRFFDHAIHNSSFKLDRAIINEIKDILESGENYLKVKQNQDKLAAKLRSDPRVKALK